MGEAKRRGPVPQEQRRGRPARWLASKLNRFRLDPDKVAAARRGKAARLTKKEKARVKRDYKRQHGLTRRDMGAIGAGHKPWPAEDV